MPWEDTHNKKRRPAHLTRGMTPMTKNILVVTGEPPNPFGMTYPRRAKQLVKKGRAAWLDEQTIRLQPDPPCEMRADEHMTNNNMTQNEWVDYFKTLVEKVILNDTVALRAIDAMESVDSGPGDTPGLAISEIVKANHTLKSETLWTLSQFIAQMASPGSVTSQAKAKETRPNDSDETQPDV